MPVAPIPGRRAARYEGVVALVLVVDDEPNIVRIVAAYLRREGFEVVTAADGPTALRTAAERRPDLVVLDLMLPEIDGLEVCRRLRQAADVPVLMLTARAEDADKIVGLTIGADDYLTKPFNPAELVARVKAVLRRTRPEPLPLRRVGPVELDLQARTAHKNGEQIALTYTEFQILAALLEQPGRVWSREQLLERAREGLAQPTFGDHRVVDVHIANLRKKIEDDAVLPPVIETVRNVGYRSAVR